MEKEKNCNCPHHKVIPACISLIGLAFLLGSIDVLAVRFVSISWSVLLIVIGLVGVRGQNCKCC